MTDNARMRAAVEVAVRIGLGRRETLEAMRRALLRNDEETALRCARQLVGLEDGGDGETSHRAFAREH